MKLHTLTKIALLFILFFFYNSQYSLHAQEKYSTTDCKIFDTKRMKEISMEQLTKKLKGADVVFFGEEHNDSIGHLLELDLLRLLVDRYEKVALSLEMFQSDAQLVLDEYLSDLITEANFIKDGKLWNNYKDYEKLIAYAKEQKITVLAANAPSRYTNRVTRHGLESLAMLSSQAKELIAPLPIDTLSGRYYEKFNALMGGHQGFNGMKIYQSQTLWDATMAYRLSQLSTTPDLKILHITGRFHCDEKLGTYQQLQKYAPKLKLINISCFPQNDGEPQDPKEYQYLADFIIFTPAKQEGDLK